ncbi:MAG: YciI family protein [Bacteroidota bacterium]
MRMGVGGNGLPMEGAKVVGHKGVVTNGPFGDIKETLGGYVIVKAANVDEAVELLFASR